MKMKINCLYSVTSWVLAFLILMITGMDVRGQSATGVSTTDTDTAQTNVINIAVGSTGMPMSSSIFPVPDQGENGGPLFQFPDASFWFGTYLYGDGPKELIQIVLSLVVIIFGIVVIVKIIQWCNKYLPPTPPTPAPVPPATNNTPPWTNKPPIVAALFTLPPSTDLGGYGTNLLATNTPYYNTLLEFGSEDIGGYAGRTQVSHMNNSTMVSANTCLAGIHAWGLAMSAAWGFASYSSNGVPVPSLPNVGFTNGVLTVSTSEPSADAAEMKSFVIERADTLGDTMRWGRISVTVRILSGMKLQVEDSMSSSNQGFYIIRPQVP